MTRLSLALLIMVALISAVAHAQVHLQCTSESGEYAAAVSIGTPAQTVKLILDTGSGNLAVTTPSTMSVIPHSPVYNPTTSSTAAPFPSSSPSCVSASSTDSSVCGTNIEYGTGGISGELYTDVVSIGGMATSSSFAFTIMTAENGGNSSTPFSATDVAGILGLSYPVLSGGDGNTQVPDLVGTVLAAHNLPNQYGFCMSAPSPVGTGYGVFTMGGTATSLYTASSLQWAYQSDTLGLIPATGFFTVNVVDFSIGSQTQEAVTGVSRSRLLSYWNNNTSGPTTIVDSGTTGLVIPDVVYNAITPIINNAENNGTTPPPLHITISGNSLSSTVVLTIPYSLYGNGNLQNYGGNGYGGILGQSVLQAYYTIFDRDNKRVGFATYSKSGCPMPSTSLEETEGPSSSPSSNNGGSNTTLAIVLPITLVAAVALIAVALYAFIRRRRNLAAAAAAQRDNALLVGNETL